MHRERDKACGLSVLIECRIHLAEFEQFRVDQICGEVDERQEFSGPQAKRGLTAAA